MAQAARSILDSGQPLSITGVALAETAYVLGSNYQVPREEILDGLIALIRKRNIRVYETRKELATQALELCRPSNRVSFGDALIWAAARSAGARVIYSFDARFPSDDIEVRSSL